MKTTLCMIVLCSLPACSTGPDTQDPPKDPTKVSTPMELAARKFEDIHELMEFTGESLDPLFGGDWDGSDKSRKELAFHAEMMTHGFGWLQNRIKPKDVKADFSEIAKDTEAFMKQLATAANKDSASVKLLFADPKAIDKEYCARCHDTYRDN